MRFPLFWWQRGVPRPLCLIDPFQLKSQGGRVISQQRQLSTAPHLRRPKPRHRCPSQPRPSAPDRDRRPTSALLHSRPVGPSPAAMAAENFLLVSPTELKFRWGALIGGPGALGGAVGERGPPHPLCLQVRAAEEHPRDPHPPEPHRRAAGLQGQDHLAQEVLRAAQQRGGGAQLQQGGAGHHAGAAGVPAQLCRWAARRRGGWWAGEGEPPPPPDRAAGCRPPARRHTRSAGQHSADWPPRDPRYHCAAAADCKDKFLIQCVKTSLDTTDVTPEMFDATKVKDIRRAPGAGGGETSQRTVTRQRQ